MLLATAVAIPFVTSSLGGLTHRVSCKTEYTSDFDVLTDGQSNAVVSSALVLTRDTATVQPRCPGFGVDMQVNPAGRQALTVYLRATNASTNAAHATAMVSVQGDTSYIPLGVLAAGATDEKTIIVNVPGGTSTLRARILLGG